MADTSRLPEAQRHARDRLKSVPAIAELYLAGGTAVALPAVPMVFPALDRRENAFPAALQRPARYASIRPRVFFVFR